MKMEVVISSETFVNSFIRIHVVTPQKTVIFFKGNFDLNRVRIYFFSSSLLPLLEHRADFSVSWSFTDSDQLISSSQSLYLNIGQHKHKKTHKHIKRPCPEWDSNPKSLPPSERRQYMPQTARLPWPASDLYNVIFHLIEKIKKRNVWYGSAVRALILSYLRILCLLESDWYADSIICKRQ
jgi:hypothetical protein